MFGNATTCLKAHLLARGRGPIRIALYPRLDDVEVREAGVVSRERTHEVVVRRDWVIH